MSESKLRVKSLRLMALDEDNPPLEIAVTVYIKMLQVFWSEEQVRKFLIEAQK